MRFSLTETFDDVFEYNGIEIRLNLAFDHVLRVLELLNDEWFTDYEKIEIALEILVENIQDVEPLPINQKHELFVYIFKEFLGVDFTQPVDGVVKKVFDFKKDAGLIYASFMRAYRIDLFEQHGKLHWHKFMQLLLNLDNQTVFKEVVSLRQMKVPPPDRYNKEYRDYILQMKRRYRLDDEVLDERQAVQAIDRKWDAVASMFVKKGR